MFCSPQPVRDKKTAKMYTLSIGHLQNLSYAIMKTSQKESL